MAQTPPRPDRRVVEGTGSLYNTMIRDERKNEHHEIKLRTDRDRKAQRQGDQCRGRSFPMEPYERHDCEDNSGGGERITLHRIPSEMQNIRRECEERRGEETSSSIEQTCAENVRPQDREHCREDTQPTAQMKNILRCANRGRRFYDEAGGRRNVHRQSRLRRILNAPGKRVLRKARSD